MMKFVQQLSKPITVLLTQNVDSVVVWASTMEK